jgi:predicted O-methyltransferase YrrM
MIQVTDINLNDLAESIISSEFKTYFLAQPGAEHYRLLASISELYNNETLLDIGTYKGCSSLALSYNNSNKIISFDVIENSVQLHNIPKNIEFVIDDITLPKYHELLINSPFIFLDTDHDGSFENKFYEYLIEINWNGTLLLDDIYLNDIMKKFWNMIPTNKKEDITKIGHWSGTGIVNFEN